MTSPETLPVIPPSVSFLFTQTARSSWLVESWCEHGRATGTMYVADRAPLDATKLVNAAQRNHELMVGCGDPFGSPTLNAAGSFQPSNAVPPGQQRVISQTGATLTGTNFYFGGTGPTCAKPGAYHVQATVQLSRSVSQNAAGVGHLIITGRLGSRDYPATMVDEAGRATANINVNLNLGPNEVLVVAYDNLSSQTQDVQTTTLRVYAVWVP